MHAIINGLRYNTETATLIGQGGSNTSSSDFRDWSGGLYKTKSGRYFVAGRGGPMTMFAHSVGDGYSGGSKIIPMDAEEALEWAERHLSNDEIEAAFGDVIKDA